MMKEITIKITNDEIDALEHVIAPTECSEDKESEMHETLCDLFQKIAHEYDNDYFYEVPEGCVAHVIDRIQRVGKWSEFWFKDYSYVSPDGFHMSCKTYMLSNVITESGLENHIDNYGVHGLTLVYQKESPFHPVKLLKKLRK